MKFGAIITAAAFCLAGVANAQSVVTTASGTGAVIKALDTLTGEVSELQLSVGQTIRYERLEITLRQCRYPVDNPAADAFAHLLIVDDRRAEPSFEGWMVGSSPALSALEHPRYDVWVIRCITPS